jgi:hypothetical protein
MNIVIAIIDIALLAMASYIFWKRNAEERIKQFYWPALLLKLISGLLIGGLYFYYYRSGDTTAYFYNGIQLANWAKTDFLGYIDFLLTDNLPHDVWLTLKGKRIAVVVYFSKFVSAFCLLTNNSYWVSALFFSFISFMGSWLLVQQKARFFQAYTVPGVVSFLFFPSVVFWAAGMLKESLAIGSLFFLSALFLRCWFGGIRLLDGLSAILAFWIFWKLKYYVAAIFLVIVVTCLAYKYVVIPLVKIRNPKTQVALWFGILVVFLFSATFLRPNFNTDRLLTVIVTNYNILHKRSHPSNVIHYVNLEDNVGSVLKNIPSALVSAVFRPFLWEARTVFQFISALENTLLLLLFLLALKNIKHVLHSEHRILMVSLIVYVTLLGVFIALSTPNFGTLSRFRIGYLPYFVFIVLCNNPLLKVAQRLFARLVQ